MLFVPGMGGLSCNIAVGITVRSLAGTRYAGYHEFSRRIVTVVLVVLPCLLSLDYSVTHGVTRNQQLHHYHVACKRKL